MFGQRKRKPSWKEFILYSSSLDILCAHYSSFALIPPPDSSSACLCSAPCPGMLTFVNYVTQTPLPWPSVWVFQCSRGTDWRPKSRRRGRRWSTYCPAPFLPCNLPRLLPLSDGPSCSTLALPRLWKQDSLPDPNSVTLLPHCC